MMTESWRVFCAIELPPQVRARVVDHVSHLRASAPTARASWARDEALHITLKFLGEIDSHHVRALSKAADNATQNVQPFSVALENTGTFPAHGAPRVLWIGITDPSGNLAKLQQSLEGECATEGFTREERTFHPHLTIARQRAPQGARTPSVLQHDVPFARVEFLVNELVVIRSELGHGGSRYTSLSRHILRSG